MTDGWMGGQIGWCGWTDGRMDGGVGSALYVLVMPSDMISVILQQEETILILSLSTTSTCLRGQRSEVRGQRSAQAVLLVPDCG